MIAPITPARTITRTQMSLLPLWYIASSRTWMASTSAQIQSASPAMNRTMTMPTAPPIELPSPSIPGGDAPLDRHRDAVDRLGLGRGQEGDDRSDLVGADEARTLGPLRQGREQARVVALGVLATVIARLARQHRRLDV